jgi:hypothetical protein
VQRGLPAIIAMRREVSVETAHLFTNHLYTHIAQTGRADAAVNEARQQLYLADPRGIAWSSPVLYSRLTDGRLWLPRGEAPEDQETLAEAPGPLVRLSLGRLRHPLPWVPAILALAGGASRGAFRSPRLPALLPTREKLRGRRAPRPRRARRHPACRPAPAFVHSDAGPMGTGWRSRHERILPCHPRRRLARHAPHTSLAPGYRSRRRAPGGDLLPDHVHQFRPAAPSDVPGRCEVTAYRSPSRHLAFRQP